MLLAEWRKSQSLSCGEVAAALGDRCDATSVWNWETGRARPDADVTELLIQLSNGNVTPSDMHAARLAWLKANRPEKFHAGEASQGAGDAGPAADRDEDAGPAPFISEAAA